MRKLTTSSLNTLAAVSGLLIVVLYIPALVSLPQLSIRGVFSSLYSLSYAVVALPLALLSFYALLRPRDAAPKFALGGVFILMVIWTIIRTASIAMQAGNFSLILADVINPLIFWPLALSAVGLMAVGTLLGDGANVK